MNLKFVINESVLIWYLLFHQSISKEMNVYKQKVWKNYCSEYKDLQKEKEIIYNKEQENMKGQAKYLKKLKDVK